jgi:hypothetical protein
MNPANQNSNHCSSFYRLGSRTDAAIVWRFVRLCGRRAPREFIHRNDADQVPRRERKPRRNLLLKLRSCIFMFLIAAPLAATAQEQPGPYWLQGPDKTPMFHSFFDQTNLRLQGINAVSETLALLAIQSHDDGGGMARCAKPPCTGALAARGRTLDPFEKHFESYGYGWGSVYRYGGGVGLNLFVAYMFHATGHHKLERWVPVVAIAHAEASTGYALTGSSQGKNGW